MKDFIKYTFATITGLIITSLVSGFCFLMFFLFIMALDGTDTAVIEDNSVLAIDLKGMIVEQGKEDNPLTTVISEATAQQGCNEIVEAIDLAASNDNIKGIYIEAGVVDADYATYQEIRNALVRFKKACPKKWIAAYGSDYTQGAYYVCSAADHVWLNPQGMVDLHGLSSETMYVKDLLEKVGVKMTVVKVGAYKSATEMYTEDHMSDANREQVTKYINGIWDNVTKSISESRKIPVDSINSYADQMAVLKSTDFLLKAKIIDKTLYADDVKEEIKKMLGIDADEEIAQVGCADVIAAGWQGDKKPSNEYLGEDGKDDVIAVYYMEGDIVQIPEEDILMGSDGGIVSTTVIQDLEKIRKDDNVKAVVLRVNSGGGDAFASEEIWHAVMKLKEKKPVVVSMGGAAASGAYYLSAGASWIVAQPTTLTGSIGIFGTFPDISRLMNEKLGLKFDHVSTNKHSDFTMLQEARPFNEEEQQMLQDYINRGYALFTKRVSDGRKIPLERVYEIAQGRVWTGADAKNIKLVDQLGGMPEAIKKAAELAKTKEYAIESYPLKPSWTDQILELAEAKYPNNLDEQMHETLGAMYEPVILLRSIERQSPVQARCPIILKVR